MLINFPSSSHKSVTFFVIKITNNTHKDGSVYQSLLPFFRWFTGPTIGKNFMFISKPLRFLFEIAFPGVVIDFFQHQLNTVLSGVLNINSSAILVSMVFGDTTGLSTTQQQLFKTTGMTHALVASGSNVGVVMQLGKWASSKFSAGKWVSYAMIIWVLVFYLLIAPPSWSLYRAAAMSAYQQLAIRKNKQYSPTFSLLLSVVVLGVISKGEAITSTSLQLSASATLAIIWLPSLISAKASSLLAPGTCPGAAAAPQVQATQSWRERLLSSCIDSFATTAAAMIGTSPVIMLKFGEIPYASLPANIFLGWLIGPLQIAGFLWSILVLIVFLPGGDFYIHIFAQLTILLVNFFTSGQEFAVRLFPGVWRVSLLAKGA